MVLSSLVSLVSLEGIGGISVSIVSSLNRFVHVNSTRSVDRRRRDALVETKFFNRGALF
jgi:hypothetical protein